VQGNAQIQHTIEVLVKSQREEHIGSQEVVGKIVKGTKGLNPLKPNPFKCIGGVSGSVHKNPARFVEVKNLQGSNC
jgi:hypothetical protein